MLEPKPQFDPAVLAASVRQVAYEAYDVLVTAQPKPRTFELVALSRRVELLKRHVPGRPSSELARWLANLGEKVESARQPDQSRFASCRCQLAAPVTG